MNQSDEASLLSGAFAGLGVALLFWGGPVATAIAVVCFICSGAFLAVAPDD